MKTASKKNSIQWPKLVGSILICQLAGILGGLATASSVNTWYKAIKKPFFTPPGWLFGPVWIALYVLMGIALYLVWTSITNDEEEGKQKSSALRIFSLQLILNATWSFSFFGLQSPLMGLINIVVLWVLIVLTIRTFDRINHLSSRLLMPYWAWVSFASLLNAAIFWLN